MTEKTGFEAGSIIGAALAGLTFSDSGNLHIGGPLSHGAVDLGHDFTRTQKLEEEKAELREKLRTQYQELQQQKLNAAQHEKKSAELEGTVRLLARKHQLNFLLDRVSADAQDALLASDALLNDFTGRESCDMFVMSVDIRRSTELMLKARSPRMFAAFITDLCLRLFEIIRLNHGVIDKFTGDGLLAFFPEFFTGPDSGYCALAAADACHAVFSRHYRERRGSFQSVLSNIGLGIGVDYGTCQLAQVPGGLTVVGAPVVYACRLASAPAGTTLLNQPAYEVVSERHGGHVLLAETEIEIKHEGPMVAYSATLSRRDRGPVQPAWKKRAEASETEDEAEKG
jgi:class 3 adenylate cyclase